MTLSTWTSGSGIPASAAIVLGAVAVAVAARAYRPVLASPDHERWFRRALLGSRLLAVLLAVVVAANPILSVEVTPRDSQRIAVLVDTSRSMGIADSIGGTTRLETAARILGPGRLLARLGELARVSVEGFDLGTHGIDLESPRALGEASDLAAAVQHVADEKTGPPLSAIVLVTDGCETSPRSLAELASRVPIYPVGLGTVEDGVEGIPDLALASVACDREVLVRSTVAVKVVLRERGLDGERATVQLRRPGAAGEGAPRTRDDGEVLAETTVVLGPGPIEVPLHFTPREPGLFELEARALPLARERIVENNSRKFAVKVGAQKLRVLYYEGTPRWEYKFLARELKKDAHLAVEAVLRTSGSQAYEQTTAPGADGGTLPATRQGFQRYDCVVLGDVRARELTADQGRALRDFVSEDSGGLVVLGGKDSLSPGGIAALGLEPLLPVSLVDERLEQGELAVHATPEARSHPALAGISRLLPLEDVYAVGSLRPGAQLLLAADGPAGARPVLAAQRYGSGRVLFFASDADWKWVMKGRAQGGEDVFVRLWGQAIRWAANRDPEVRRDAAGLALSTDKEIYRAGEAVKVRAVGADLPASGVEARIDGAALALARGPDGAEGVFRPERTGLHHVVLADSSCDFLVEPAAGELDRIAIQETLLRKVAAESGGQYFDATTAGLLPDALRASGRLRLETREHALGESWIVYLALVLVLGAEWAARKRVQVI